ncbi:MORN repeat-containing protein 1 isoform X14 [Balaenoptera ricei]|uniref:MORN repeat-containing protein 1 isoform X14 n=1 Tax=Balaenoptera ricei TaxID=2746895 RepID=UPI0028BE9700|nr:MORN repeat-containing protein 1 isoform X14 [Balaenoptera ricei]
MGARAPAWRAETRRRGPRGTVTESTFTRILSFDMKENGEEAGNMDRGTWWTQMDKLTGGRFTTTSGTAKGGWSSGTEMSTRATGSGTSARATGRCAVRTAPSMRDSGTVTCSVDRAAWPTAPGASTEGCGSMATPWVRSALPSTSHRDHDFGSGGDGRGPGIFLHVDHSAAAGRWGSCHGHHKCLFLDTERGWNLTCGRAPPLPPAQRAALLSSLWTTSLPSCPPSALLTCVRGRQSSPWRLAAVNIHVQVFV